MKRPIIGILIVAVLHFAVVAVLSLACLGQYGGWFGSSAPPSLGCRIAVLLSQPELPMTGSLLASLVARALTHLLWGTVIVLGLRAFLRQRRQRV